MAVPRTSATPFGAGPVARSTAPYAARPTPTDRRPHPFAHAFLGGLVGFGLAALLLGHGFGLLLPLALILLLVYVLRRRGAARVPAAAVPLGEPDRRAFTDRLVAVQRAWTTGDRAALGRLMTPEMAGILGGQLDALARRGARNSVDDVRIQQAAVAESWREGPLDYASIGFRYMMIDVTTDAAGRVIDGSPGEHVTIAETWTFVRRAGTAWIVSAIQPG